MTNKTTTDITDRKIQIYQVCDWDKYFEGAKSKTYNNKSLCSMPTKHGLGYRKIVRSKDGAAVFGAWCALIQVLSRHEKPRQGYCTDTGSVHGIPYTPEDLEILTDIKKTYYEKLFSIVQSIGWVVVKEVKDTIGIPQDIIPPPQYPPNSNSNPDSNLNPDSDSDSNPYDFRSCMDWLKKDQTIENAVLAVYASNDSFGAVPRMHIESTLSGQPDRNLWHPAIEGMASKFAGVEMKFPNLSLKNWLAGKPIDKTERRVSEL